MGFFSKFKKKKNNQSIQVTEHKQNILNDSAAAVAFSEQGEHDTARSMIDRSKGKRTILVAANGDSFSETLNNYALDMAKRLDYEILALNVSEPFSGAEEQRKKEEEAFRESCKCSVQKMQENAEKIGVSVSGLIEWGHLDDVVARLHTQYPGMRYVLTEPDPDIVQTNKGRTEIPVFDLGSLQTSAV